MFLKHKSQAAAIMPHIHQVRRNFCQLFLQQALNFNGGSDLLLCSLDQFHPVGLILLKLGELGIPEPML